MWQQPKTDWQSGDYFNIGDYNRIKGNINEIRAQALTLWPDFEFEEDRKSTRLNSSHLGISRMPSSA